jgi:hypothetical protein
MNPVTLLGSFNGTPPLCADINTFEKKSGHLIDYIALWNYSDLSDTCSISIQTILAKNFHLIYNEEEKLKLYQHN